MEAYTHSLAIYIYIYHCNYSIMFQNQIFENGKGLIQWSSVQVLLESLEVYPLSLSCLGVFCLICMLYRLICGGFSFICLSVKYLGLQIYFLPSIS